MTTNICPKCDFANEETAAACSRCGRELRPGGPTFPLVSPAPPVPSILNNPNKAEPPPPGPTEDSEGPKLARHGLLAIILMMTAGSVIYRLLVYENLEQSSILFIGIPSILAVIAVLTPKANSTLGVILKGMTICLLMSGILLGEGFICIVMASPLFYFVGLIVGLIADGRKRNYKDSRRGTLSLLLLPLVPLSLEGSLPALSFNRDETVQVERVVDATAAEVESELASCPAFKQPLPLYLKMGFPRPVHASGSGLNQGDTRAIYFAGGEGKPGTLAMEVAEHGPGLVRFRALSDTSHVSHWLDWNEADITFSEIAPRKTRVVWRLRFARRLDPAWYFAPWERYAAGLAAGYLIDTLATPNPRR